MPRRSVFSRLVLLCCCLASLGCRQLAGYDPATPGADVRPEASSPLFDAGLDRSSEADGSACPVAPLLGPPLVRLTFDDTSFPWKVANLGSVGGLAKLHGGIARDEQGLCGGALRNVIQPAPAATGYLELHDAPALHLAEGLIELWVRFDRDVSELTAPEGIVSRDAVDQQQAGHLSLMRMDAGHLLARLQLADQSAGIACVGASSIVVGRWHHVIVAFGGAGELELYLDGVRGTLKTTQGWRCGEKSNTQGLGVDGNANPWVVGASSINSVEGQAEPVTLPLAGAIDELRVYGSRYGY
jgi:hypothetical protein